MAYHRLCESDYRFLSLIWTSEPVNSTELVRLCGAELGWKKSTVFTMLRKMNAKGLAKNENSVVTSLVSRERVRASESALFMERTFSGSLPDFLVAFLGGKTVSDAEAEELRRLIDAHREA